MAEQSSLFGEENTPGKKQAAQQSNTRNAIGGEPLAARMRPRSVDEIVGQEQISRRRTPVTTCNRVRSYLVHDFVGTTR